MRNFKDLKEWIFITGILAIFVIVFYVTTKLIMNDYNILEFNTTENENQRLEYLDTLN
jgi:hypothetical protein